MIQQINFLEKTILDTWGGSLNDLEETSYFDLLEILNAKAPEVKEQVQSAFDFFKSNSIYDVD